MIVEINWKPDTRELHKFGLTMLLMMPLAGWLLSWKLEIPGVFPALWIVGIVVDFCSIFLPPAGLLLYKAWMGLAVVMAAVVSPVVLGIIYYAVFTPMGLALRLLGKDSMQRKKRGSATYWVKIDHKTDVRSYERGF